MIADIYSLFDPDKDHEPSEAFLDEFANNLKDILRTRFKAQDKERGPLRFSGLGKPNRQFWFDANPDGNEEELTSQTYLKFLFGDMYEQLLLLLIKEAGHTVEMEQGEVEVDGVKGHIDAIVDGVVVDVKSASPFGYQRFNRGQILEDDPFGYVAQLSGYANVLTPGREAAWIVVDKVSGEICVPSLSSSVIKDYKPEERITELKQVLESPEPPAEKCYDDIPDGKSGNRKLATGCSYCKHKFRCWDALRVFSYSTGPRFLTNVSKVPEVKEITESWLKK